MSVWKAKALELFPKLKGRLSSVQTRQSMWLEVQRECHEAKARGDDITVSNCLKYAAWTLHPTPQAKTMSDVSESAAILIYGQADELHRWLDRYDFMIAQKGLRFHLGDEKYAEFEARFLKKTRKYPHYLERL